MITSLLLNNLKATNVRPLARNVSKRRQRIKNWRSNKENTTYYSGFKMKKIDVMSEDI